jgi:hypothetical protein
MMAVAFVENPGAHFTVESEWLSNTRPLGSTLFHMSRLLLNSSPLGIQDVIRGILGRIVNRLFHDQFVLPQCRQFYLPLLNPMDALALIKMQLLLGTETNWLYPPRE